MNKKVIYVGCDDDQVNFGSNDDPRGVLKLGQTYEIDKIEVHSWHTKYYLKFCPYLAFNSVCFKDA